MEDKPWDLQMFLWIIAYPGLAEVGPDPIVDLKLSHTRMQALSTSFPDFSHLHGFHGFTKDGYN